MRVPFVDVAAPYREIESEVLAAIAGTLHRGDFILGEEVARFEAEFADVCGTTHAVGVNSGTDALVLSLRALGVGPGDEVITAPNSFLASASAVVLCGARPVFADVGDDMNLDPERVRAALTERTRAIVPVHLYGCPARMDRILELASEAGLAVVEDCSQAHGARFDGRVVGSLGAAGAFSLHPLKNLSAAGDAGVITTDDPALAERLRLLRNHGLRSRNECLEWSPNSRLDTLQAAILRVKLRSLAAGLARRRDIAERYRRAFAGIDGLTLQPEEAPAVSAFNYFVVRCGRRDELAARLAERDVGSAVHYPTPIHLLEAAASLGYRRGDFPNAERQADTILSLPIFPEMSDAMVDHVCAAVRSFFG